MGLKVNYNGKCQLANGAYTPMCNTVVWSLRQKFPKQKPCGSKWSCNPGILLECKKKTKPKTPQNKTKESKLSLSENFMCFMDFGIEVGQNSFLAASHCIKCNAVLFSSNGYCQDEVCRQSYQLVLSHLRQTKP